MRITDREPRSEAYLSRYLSRALVILVDGIIIPLKIARMLAFYTVMLCACIHANCRIYYGVRRVCIWESELRADTPCWLSSMWIFSIFVFFLLLFLFTSVDFWISRHCHDDINKSHAFQEHRDRRHRDKMIHIGLLIFRHGVMTR